MRSLRFVALSEDGTQLVLAPDVPEAIDNGERYLVPVDDRLRAAARGDMSRLGQIEIELESSLRPRDIQARIRAGDTPEDVAAVAGIRVEKVLRYAYPVLQERAQIASQARTARVRLADGTPASLLGEFVIEKLSLSGINHRDATWDARKLPDGGWEVLVGWGAGAKRGITHWWYDAPARSVTPADADTSRFAERPFSAVTPAASPRASAPAAGPGPDARDDADVRDGAGPGDAPAPGPGTADGARETPQADPPVRGATTGSEKNKAHIPSWDDIVFGVRRKRP